MEEELVTSIFVHCCWLSSPWHLSLSLMAFSWFNLWISICWLDEEEFGSNNLKVDLGLFGVHRRKGAEAFLRAKLFPFRVWGLFFEILHSWNQPLNWYKVVTFGLCRWYFARELEGLMIFEFARFLDGWHPLGISWKYILIIKKRRKKWV